MFEVFIDRHIRRLRRSEPRRLTNELLEDVPAGPGVVQVMGQTELYLRSENSIRDALRRFARQRGGAHHVVRWIRTTPEMALALAYRLNARYPAEDAGKGLSNHPCGCNRKR